MALRSSPLSSLARGAHVKGPVSALTVLPRGERSMRMCVAPKPPHSCGTCKPSSGPTTWSPPTRRCPSEPGFPDLADAVVAICGSVLLPVARASEEGIPLPLQWSEYRSGTLVAAPYGLFEPPPPWLPPSALGSAEHRPRPGTGRRPPRCAAGSRRRFLRPVAGFSRSRRPIDRRGQLTTSWSTSFPSSPTTSR